MSHDLYLDANATSPVLPAAARAALDAMEACFGNPSSSHATGLRARALLDAVRARARRVLGAETGRVLFTSGATEGIQTAVLSALCAVRERQAAGEACGDLLLYGATEHKAVSESLAHWNRLLATGLTLCALPVDGAGRHRLDLLRELAPRAAMVCTMAANNETGAVSDLDGIAAVLREHAPRAYWMVDCVQALGKLPLTLANTRIDYAPFSGHKLYAPKGIGMLYVREGAPYTPLMIGGGQEAGQRSGTENMAGIAALGAVLAALEEGTTFRSHAELAAMRERVAASLADAFPGIVFNAPFDLTLPTTLNFAVPDMASKDLLDLFDAAGVRVSAGSACSAAKAAPSYVLEAMGLPSWRASGAVRLSFGPLATEEFIDEACARIRRCGQAARLPALAPSRFSGDSRGLLQLGAGGQHGWIPFDAVAGACVLIDPPAGMAARIAAQVRGSGLRVLAVLGTGADPSGADARAALRTALGLDSHETGALGWPRDGAGETVALADGRAAPAIAIGDEVLVRLAMADGGAAYLLGPARGGRLDAAAVRLAFTGGIALREADLQDLARLIDGATVLCHGADIGGVSCGTAARQRAAASAQAESEAVQQLQPERLHAFLRAHEDALLVDVREACEREAGGMRLHGIEAQAVPLSRLAEHLGGLLAAPRRPLVFVCRSGNRSARAALCLQRLGHAQAWSLAGGLALSV
ncbi:cysteine desulfurase [Massilia sp. WF1]|uniref:aminotransferase class V-fold PLP-dependent enzyme n=1 Tax=unclassified Massilia TaxID=2609279 RepID=UPI00068C87D7|nr:MULTISPECIES: aminotransferase class V-fold PLP-dependent enzyme [unclassified Massilia]ALK95326.1 cysteine desulfurase [Massilia sp. WG5]KNZ67342.1 cysteine desulfurase [Massilia sp. WF1]